MIRASLVAALVLSSTPAPAQGVPGRAEDPVAAMALFKSALELVGRGDWAAGCPKFEASLALHPSASTMIHIAQCHEHEGKIATAWEDYARAVSLNHETQGADRQKALEVIAQRGLSGLEPRLPRLRIVVVAPPAGLQVTRDGVALAVAALGEALPANPGPHEVRVSAPGYRPEARAVTLAEGATSSLEIALVPAPAAAPDPPRGAPVPQVPPDARPPGVPIWAWVSGGVGLALAGVGAFFLADDLSAISALQKNCTTDATGTHCVAGYDYAHDNARKDRDLPLAVALGGAGVVGIGAAVVSIVTAPRASAAPPVVSALPWIGPTRAGATLSVRF